MTLVDERGAPVALGERLGAGGEGNVHATGPSRVAKVLFPKSRNKLTHDKIRQMIARPPPGAGQTVDGFPVLSWPTGMLYDGRPSRSRFVGYTMPRVQVQRDFIPLYQVSSAARRQSLGGGNLTWDRLLVLGLRITHVVRTLHAMDYAVGDLNDRNILVSRKLTPLFLDTDSFQVPRGLLGHYPCRVGDRLYWPPELLGVDLATYNGSRVPGDRYGLAVLLFQLFLNGMRPYQARGRDVEHLDTLEKKTEAGVYPWAHPRRGRLEPPASAPDYRALPERLRATFEKAFVAGHHNPRRRPTADDWYRTLKRMADDGFQSCARVATHRFLNSQRRCPWCADRHDPFRPTQPTAVIPTPRPSISTPILARPAAIGAGSRYPWAPWRP